MWPGWSAKGRGKKNKWSHWSHLMHKKVLGISGISLPVDPQSLGECVLAGVCCCSCTAECLFVLMVIVLHWWTEVFPSVFYLLNFQNNIHSFERYNSSYKGQFLKIPMYFNTVLENINIIKILCLKAYNHHNFGERTAAMYFWPGSCIHGSALKFCISDLQGDSTFIGKVLLPE